jgi:hypothetical protein
MNKTVRTALQFLVILTFFSSPAFPATQQGQEQSTQQTVSYLIGAVANSHLIFMRNGEKHTCEEAAKHMTDKYNYFKPKIKTPEDFIQLCASKSLLSGKAYMVDTAQGVIPTETWLNQILSKYQESRKSF